jgi:hypothetical protein
MYKGTGRKKKRKGKRKEGWEKEGMKGMRIRERKQIKLWPMSSVKATFVPFRRPSHHFSSLVHNARLTALTAVLMKIQVFWDIFRNKHS